ncbi:MAG: hypothetical protein N4A49_01500 [Marinifilaceae bacterium]|jgi:N-acetylneuraminic acid mutarotase|nr:hypothetical protein [Marinifilaceae bacterium]
MKVKSIFGLFIACLFALTSCNNDDDLQGNWKLVTEFSGLERSAAVSFVIGDIAYVGTGSSDKPEMLKSFYSYDMNKNTWNEIAEFPGEGRKNAVAFTAGGKGYVGLGYNEKTQTFYNDFYEYNPGDNTWVKLADDPNSPPACDAAVAFGHGANGYVGGGKGEDDNDKLTGYNEYYKYSTADKKWSKVGAFGDKIYEANAFVIGDYAYICLGTKYGSTLSKNIYKFNCTTDTFEGKLKPLDDRYNTDKVMRTNAVTFVIGDKAYIAAGTGTSGTIKTVWEYNPTNDKWVERAELVNDMPVRVDAVAFSNNKKGFITTGKAGTVSLSDTWELEPTRGKYDDDDY